MPKYKADDKVKWTTDDQIYLVTTVYPGASGSTDTTYDIRLESNNNVKQKAVPEGALVPVVS